jgi:alginate O-acetyltransferase complex protein AlgJ
LRASRITAVVFLLVLAVGFALSVVGLLRSSEDAKTLRATAAEAPSLMSGSLTAAVDTAVEEHHPLRSAAVSVLSATRYLLFGDATGAAVIGSGRWLFTAEELEHHPEDAARLDERLAQIAAAAARLAALDVDLIVALVPSKARLYAERLAPRLRGLADHPRLARAVAELGRLGIDAVDLQHAFAPAGVADPSLFFARDTHWTPAGARVAAQAIAAEVARTGVRPERGGNEYERVEEEPVRVDGDLLTFLPVGVLGEALGLTSEVATPVRAMSVGEGGLGLFDDPVIPVALVGTSYSRDERWGFAEELKIALGADVLNVAAEGQGPFEPMRSYLESATIRDTRPDLVVWEIPERYLTLPVVEN